MILVVTTYSEGKEDNWDNPKFTQEVQTLPISSW